MTQLFDTNAFALADDAQPSAAAADGPGRHLRSIPAGADLRNDDDLSARTTQWQLDQDTIEAGRRGLAKARAVLKETKKGRRAA